MNNPPAFPNDVNPINERVGMTLRDYFAAKASEEDVESHREGPITDHIVQNSNGQKQIVKRRNRYTREQAKYRYADAMLCARQTTQGDTNV